MLRKKKQAFQNLEKNLTDNVIKFYGDSLFVFFLTVLTFADTASNFIQYSETIHLSRDLQEQFKSRVVFGNSWC